LYGVATWITIEGGKKYKKKTAGVAQSIQEKYLCVITGAYKATSTGRENCISAWII
jgi:hypothetical protein